MSEENQHIDPALLADDNPSGLNPDAAVNGGISLKERPRGIKKINKKGIVVAAGVIGIAAIVASTTFNGTGSAVSSAAKDAVKNQGTNRPTEVKRDALWYANVPDKLTTNDSAAMPGTMNVPGMPAAAPMPNGKPTVPDLTGKAVTPLGGAVAARTGAAAYDPNTAAGAAPGAPMPQLSQAEQMAQQQEAQAKQKKQADMDSAMKAGLGASGFGDNKGAAAMAAALPSGQASGGMLKTAMPGAGPASLGGQQREDDPNKQERKDQFLKLQREAVDSAYSSSTRTAARSEYELKAGGIIPAILLTGLNSDLPGQVIGQVSETVYDTKTGQYPLIPQGTKIIGLYDAHVAYGQQRVLLAWNRLIFPDGSSFDLKGMPGADKSGYAGFTDEIDNHYAKIFGSAVLLSFISAGVQLTQPSNGNSNTNQPSVSQTLGSALGQQIGQTGMTITQKNLNIQPTLEIRPGYKFNIMVSADMILVPSLK